MCQSTRVGCRHRQRGNPAHGFALLGVLWIIVGLSVLALAVGTVGRHAVTVATIDHDRIVGRWLAEGCVARLRSVTNRVLAEVPTRAGTVWRTLDRLILRDSVAVIAGCDVSLHPDGRTVLDRASIETLDSLPGMTPEAVAQIIRLQQMGTPIPDLLAVEGTLSPSSKAIFDAHYVDLVRLTTIEPDAWLVRSRAHVGVPPTPVNIEIRLVRAGSRAAIMRWVEW